MKVMLKISSKVRDATVWLIWMLIVGVGAYAWAERMRPSPAQGATALSFRRQAPYPPARWRLATQEQLEPTLLWVSHILIRYDGVSSDVPFSAPGWHNGLPVSHRSRQQALERAREIAGELRAHPSEFTDYAQRYSEDPPTRSSGGSLGGISAYQLSYWPVLLDALSTLAPGEVSEPVETPYGFHVLLRRAPAAPDTVTGTHIVIGHDGARWLQNMLARGNGPLRTREEARTMAQSLYERALQDPEQFQSLIDRYSEHRDAAQHGDMGTWSTRETTPFPRQVEVLQSLPVGGVAPPIESLLGFEVLMRVPNRPRKEYSMTTIGLLFDPFAEPSDPLSQVNVLELARRLRRELEQDPSRFETFQNTYCCPGNTRWREGPEYPELDAVFEHLAVGQIPPQPVESVRQYLIPRRLPLEAVAKSETLFELPAPEHPDLAYLIGRMSASLAREALREFAHTSLSALNLGASETARLIELHEQPWEAALDQATVEERSAAFAVFLQKLEHELPGASFQQYRSLLESVVADQLLHRHPL
ncbi:MAG TPA: peptidylprolyl isomerase [Polyangiaceae bacterium]|nr:peptidylprolyl isomerase [Polyangiaceae bacterium]